MPIRILAVVPVELHPLVPEGEGVHLESVRLDLLDKVCGPAFIIPPARVIGTPRGHKVTLYYCKNTITQLTSPTLSIPIPASPMVSSLSHTAVLPVMFCSNRNTSFRSVLFFTYSRLLISNAYLSTFKHK